MSKKQQLIFITTCNVHNRPVMRIYYKAVAFFSPVDYLCFHHSGLECHQNVSGIRQIFHLSRFAANATRVLEQIHAGEAIWRTPGGVPRLSMGLLQPERLQVNPEFLVLFFCFFQRLVVILCISNICIMVLYNCYSTGYPHWDVFCKEHIITM